MSSNQLVLPRLRPDQYEIVADPAKVKVIAAGRRWGKSTTGLCVTLAPAAALGARAAWCVPNFANSRPLWRAAVSSVAPLVAAKLCKVNNTSQIISFQNGGFLAIYSLDNADSIRGESFHIACIDEAGQISEEVINEAVSPTLADEDGVLYIIGTPKGRGNGFHKEFLRGLTDDTGYQKSWNAPSSNNPNPNIQKAVEQARIRISSRSFKQEWLAEFLENGGEVFSGINECITVPLIVEPYKGTFVAGVDWGRSNDYTVCTVMDVNSRRIVEIIRFNQIGYSFQREKLAHLSKKWNVQAILAEKNSIGDPNIEALQKDGLPISGWTATNSTKSEMIQSLVLAIENHNIGFPPFSPLIAELEGYAMDVLPSGLTRYGAPSGMHDDTVISAGLALKAAETGTVRYHPGLY